VIIVGPAAGTPTSPQRVLSHPSLWRVCGASLVSPRSTACRLADCPDERQGWAAVIVFAAAYSAAAFTSFVTRRLPQRPMLRFVRPERYYLWESVFLTPVTLAWSARAGRRPPWRIRWSDALRS
jgi:hypothetical protein